MRRARKAPGGAMSSRPQDPEDTGEAAPRVSLPECLGPMPIAALACLIDLGMTDAEIATYFGLGLSAVVALTAMLRTRMHA